MVKTLIVYQSYHHGNTKKIAEAMAEELEANVLKPEEVDLDDIDSYDLIGFGSGIYGFRHHKDILDLVAALPEAHGKKAFVLSTSGSGKNSFNKDLSTKLSEIGYEVIGDFACKGFNTVGPFGIVGGVSKGRPDENDLEEARDFARKLKHQ